MRSIAGRALLIAWVCISATTGWAADKTEGLPGNDYIIGAGDVLEISVWKNEDLTKLLTVLPDGKISFPLIGEVMAEGKTLAQFKKELESKISRYVPDPVLSVVIQQLNSNMIYVIGKVRNPGRFALNSDIRVLQGLALAGGLNPFAEQNKIRIFREEGGKTLIFHFRYDDVSTGKRMEQNIWLKRGDIIVVR
jgi:polysaccharide export outer membrane protein